MVSGSRLRKTLKQFLFILSLLAFALSTGSLLKHWDYQESLQNLSTLLRSRVDSSTLTAEIESAIRQNNLADARMYLEIASSHHYKINTKKYLDEIEQKDTTFNQISTNVSDFSRGFIQGKSTNMAGLAGSVSADFTVLGDVRDLYQQYGLYAKGENVNELVVVLSGTGIGLTALTLASIGVSAPAKVGTSLIKVAAKAQRLTRPFQKTLLKLGKKVFNWRMFKQSIKQDKSITNLRRAAKAAYQPRAVEPLKNIAKRVNHIGKLSSTTDAIQMLKYVETTDDLRHLEKVTLKYGTKTKGMMKLLGKGAIRTVRVLRKTTALMLSVISSVLSSLLSLFFMMSFRRA